MRNHHSNIPFLFQMLWFIFSSFQLSVKGFNLALRCEFLLQICCGKRGALGAAAHGVCGKGRLLRVPGAPWGGLITPGEVGEKKGLYVSCNLQDSEMFPSVIFLKLKLRLLRFT